MEIRRKTRVQPTKRALFSSRKETNSEPSITLAKELKFANPDKHLGGSAPPPASWGPSAPLCLQLPGLCHREEHVPSPRRLPREAAEDGRAFCVSHGKVTSRSAEGRFLGPTRTCWSISDGNKITGGTQGPAGFPESAEGLFPPVWQEHQALLGAGEPVRAHTHTPTSPSRTAPLEGDSQPPLVCRVQGPSLPALLSGSS